MVLTRCPTAIQITAKAYALVESDLAVIVKDLSDAKAGVAVDVGLALSALLGVVTYEEGVVKVYADIIVVRRTIHRVVASYTMLTHVERAGDLRLYQAPP